MVKYIIGYDDLIIFEDEKGKKQKIKEYQEVTEINSDLNEKETLKIFIDKNKNLLLKRNIPINKLKIEVLKDISFKEMVNIFKSRGLK